MLYTCGKNKFGQLGHGDRVNRFYPTPIKFDEELQTKKIKILSASESNSCFVTSNVPITFSRW